MFLSCSYFLRNLSLNVLINMVLIKEKACSGDDDDDGGGSDDDGASL